MAQLSSTKPAAKHIPPQIAQLAVVRSTRTILWRTLAVVFVGNTIGGMLVLALGIQDFFISLLLESLLVAVVCLPGLFRAILRPATELAAEQAAAGAEARFNTIANAVKDAIIIFDTERKIRFANGAAERMYRYRHQSLTGENVERLIPEELWPQFQRAIAQHLDPERGTITDKGLVESEGLRKDGSRFPIELRVNALPERDGVCFVAVLREITARKQAETALRESEALFRSLADTAPVMIWTSDASGKCTFFNKQWLDFRGRTLEQEKGDGWMEGMHSDDHEQCSAVYRAAFEARATFEIQYRLLRADGEYRWVLERGTPRYNAEGNYAGTIGSCIDVTARKEMEDSLRASEKKFRSFLDSLPIAVRIIQGSEFVFANPADAALHGFESPAEEFAAGPDSQIAPEDLPRVNDYALRRAAGEDVPSRYEIRRRRRDGSEFPAELKVERILYNGAPASIVVIRDLTESKRIEMYEKLLPVCCVCGRIRDDSRGAQGAGAWERLDRYLSKHSNTQFSHTFCPDCFEEYKKQNLMR
jgi:PAS domain S-box-containing protein